MARAINILFWLLLAAFVIEFSLNIRVSPIPGFSLKNMAMYSLILVMLVANPAMNKPLIGKNSVNVPIVFFILYCLASLLATALFKVVPNYSLATELVLFKSYMDPYVLFIVVYSAVHDEKSINNLLFALVGVLIVFLSITLLSSFGVLSVGRVTVDERWGRTTGAFSEPNQFAAYVVLFMPLLFVFFRQTHSKLMKVFFALGLFAAAYVVLLTGSRGGIVSLTVAVGVYYLLSSRHVLARSVLNLIGVYMAAFVGLFLVSLILPPETVAGLISRFTGEFENEVATDYSSGRLTIWALALKQFVHYPLFGTGWRTFIPIFGANSHNDYILFLVTTGIVGFCLYILVYVRLLKSAFHLRAASEKYRPFYNAYIAGLASVLTAMMFVNIYNPSYFILLYSALMLKLGAVATETTDVVAEPGAAVSSAHAKVMRRRRNSAVLGKAQQ